MKIGYKMKICVTKSSIVSLLAIFLTIWFILFTQNNTRRADIKRNGTHSLNKKWRHNNSAKYCKSVEGILVEFYLELIVDEYLMCKKMNTLNCCHQLLDIALAKLCILNKNVSNGNGLRTRRKREFVEKVPTTDFNSFIHDDQNKIVSAALNDYDPYLPQNPEFKTYPNTEAARIHNHNQHVELVNEITNDKKFTTARNTNRKGTSSTSNDDKRMFESNQQNQIDPYLHQLSPYLIPSYSYYNGRDFFPTPPKMSPNMGYYNPMVYGYTQPFIYPYLYPPPPPPYLFQHNQQWNEEYIKPVNQWNGLTGQYYMCHPIPPPFASDGIISVPGVEIRGEASKQQRL